MTLEETWHLMENELNKLSPEIKERKRNDLMIEYAGTKEVMQGKQKVDGHYFSTLMKKPKDVRFYFFPIYTHASEFKKISSDLKKLLKGKSCFHLKNLDQNISSEICGLIIKGVELYKRDNLI